MIRENEKTKYKLQKRSVPKTSWDSVAPWYDRHLEDSEGTFQRDIILPNILRIAGIHPGDSVCDIACGQGFFSREFANTGARVVGIDASSRLIAFAKSRAKENEKYSVASSDALSMVQSGSIDIATIILAIQNIENAQKTISEASRILKKGGRLIMVLNHPAFRVPKESSWGWDEENKIQYRRVEGYYNEWKIKIQMHPGDAPHLTTISFHRPLQYYVKALRKADLCIIGLEEWISNKKSQKGPRKIAEDKARKEIPLFMEIEARKI